MEHNDIYCKCLQEKVCVILFNYRGIQHAISIFNKS